TTVVASLIHKGPTVSYRYTTLLDATKFELMQPERGEFQYQAHGTPFEGVSVWILHMGPYAAATFIR
ncbi:hypothetical protein, partial [Corynebacterium sp. KPL2680]|uniref:hypothetical protein n=1 Tax=Corynebacterium sp. KPL2680 TaxID=3158310 RepID=UPI0032EC2AB9